MRIDDLKDWCIKSDEVEEDVEYVKFDDIKYYLSEIEDKVNDIENLLDGLREYL